MYLYNSTEYVEGMLACVKIRAVPVNVNYRYVEGELRYLFTDADLVALLHQREFVAARSPPSGPRSPSSAIWSSSTTRAAPTSPGSGRCPTTKRSAAASPARDFEPRSPDDLFIIYTGGTTGMPKGVMWRQEDIFFTAMGGGNPMGEPIEKPEQLGENAAQARPAARAVRGAAADPRRRAARRVHRHVLGRQGRARSTASTRRTPGTSSSASA